MVVETILTSEFAVRIIYPFLLVFVLIFAVLQKSKILGDDKKQIDSLVALSIALIVVAINWATDVITQMMPFLAITLVSILVFLLIYGFVASDNEKGIEFPTWAKGVFAIIATLVVIIALIVSTGQWDKVYDFVVGGDNSSFWTNAILIVAVVVVVVVVLLSGKGKVRRVSLVFE